jgi:hypothetical protein
MSPHEASESQPTSACGSTYNNGNETSRSVNPETSSSVAASTDRNSGNHESHRTAVPTSLPALPRRERLFPFILPLPLGDVSPPEESYSRTGVTELNKSAPANHYLQNLNHSQVNVGTVMAPRRIKPDHSGGISESMPHPTTAPTTGLKRHVDIGNMNEMRFLAPLHRLPQPCDSQVLLSQHPANTRHTLAIGTGLTPSRQEHAPVSRHPSVEGTHNWTWETTHHYHKCDECNASFASHSWLQQHKTTHLRFRCRCGAAYDDKILFLVSISLLQVLTGLILGLPCSIECSDLFEKATPEQYGMRAVPGPGGRNVTRSTWRHLSTEMG